MFLCLLEATLLASHLEHRTFIEMTLSTPPQKETETPLHPLAKQLLKEYSYVFLEEIPSSLAPQRTTQYQIDLIPEAVLPNKPTYRMNPKALQKK